MSAEVRSFPNPATQFKPGVGGDRKGKPKPLIGKRTARRLRRVQAMHGVVEPRPEELENLSTRQWLTQVRSGRLVPTPTMLAAAQTLAAMDSRGSPASPEAMQLVESARRIAAMPVEQRHQRWRELAGRMDNIIEGTAEPEAPRQQALPPPDPVVAALLQREAELKAQIAEAQSEAERPFRKDQLPRAMAGDD